MTYTWTDNAMQGGGTCDVDKVNDNLMYLKYDNVSPQDGKVPYSVNSAHRNANGYADFINKVTNTEVSFDIDDGTSYAPLAVTYPDGSTETTTSQSNIDSGMSSDDTYYFVKEKGSAISVTTATITEDIVAPSSPSDGDYWLDISVKPYKPYKRVSGAWTETQFIKIGEVTKTSGILGTPISYALNGYTIIRQSSITKNNIYSLNHNIGSDLIEPIGYYETLSGWTLTIPSDQTGKFYLNGYGDYASNSSGTNIVNIHKNTLKLVTESTYIWSSLGEYGYGRATTGDLTLIIKRSF